MFMHFRFLPLWRRKVCIILLAFSLCAGLYLGIHAASSADISFLPLMRTAAQTRVSIVGLFSILLLPFLFSAFAVFLSQPWLLLLVCFVKAFSFGFCGFASQVCFGSAGWLIRLLLMFSDCFIFPVLCWFLLRHITGEMRAVGKDLAVCTAFVVFIGSVDYCLISPFLATLIDF